MAVDIATLALRVDATQVNTAGKALDDLSKQGDKAEKSTLNLAAAAKTAAAAFGAFKLVQIAKDAAMLAARFETMGVVMRIAGNNAGYTGAQMEAFSKSLQKSGISMLQSRDALTQLATANIDLANASKLGRAAQDLAVVGNINSSDALSRLIHGIKSAEVETLRTIGLNVSFEDGYKKIATQLGKNVNQLTNQEKALARTNTVLEGSARYAGIYEESMTTAGKAMGSLTRWIENLQVMAGEAFLPTLADMVFKLTDAIKAANIELEKAGSSGTISGIGDGLKGAFQVVYETVAVLGANVAYVFNGIGREIGGIAAQVAAILRGDFKQAGVIRKQMIADNVASEKALDAYTKKILENSSAVVKKTTVSEADRIAAAAAAKALQNQYETETTAIDKLKKNESERIKLLKAAQAATEDYINAGIAHVKQIDDETKSLKDKATELEFENTLIGKTADEIAKLESKRASQEIQLVKERLALVELAGDRFSEADAIRDQIIQLERLKSARESKVSITAETTARTKAIADEQKAHEDMWKSIESTAHDTWNKVWKDGSNAFTNIGKTLKSAVMDMLYQMTLKKWVFNISVAGSAGSSGSAMASGGGYDTGYGSILSSGMNMAMSSLSFGEAMGASAAYASAAMEATTLSGALSMGASSLSLAMPYIGAAVAAVSLIGGLFSSSGPSAIDLGRTNVTAGVTTGKQTATSDYYVTGMQTAYESAIKSLGGTLAQTSFEFGSARASDNSAQWMAIGGGVGTNTYLSGQVSMTTEAIQLESSRAVLQAVKSSDLPAYLSKIFDGLTVSSMTTADIDNVMKYALSVKDMRSALLETRAPLEVFRADVTDAMAAASTSAATFRTDFVSAIDAGIDPATFEAWKALGTAIDELAAADAQAAAAAAQAAADALDIIIKAANDALDAAKSSTTKIFDSLSLAVDKERQTAISAYEASVKAVRTQLDGITATVGNLRNLSQALSSTLEQMIPTSRGDAQAQISAAIAIAKAGGVLPSADSLQPALTALSKPSEGLFGNFVDYQRDFFKTASDIKELGALTDTQLTVADQQLVALETQLTVLEMDHLDNMMRLDTIISNAQAQIDAVNGTTVAVMSVSDAIVALASALGVQAAAKFAVDATAVTPTQYSSADIRNYVSSKGLTTPAEIYAAAVANNADVYAVGAAYGLSAAETDLSLSQAGVNRLPGFAVGTDYVPYDMTANIHKGERITPAAYNRSDATNADLIAEIKALREEIRAGNMSIAATSSKTARVLDRWDGDGIPAARVL